MSLDRTTSDQPDLATVASSADLAIAARRLQSFVDIDAEPAEGGEFILRLGQRPTLFVAPHAVRHWRDGRWKQPDVLTGLIALEAARRTGAGALVMRAVSLDDGTNGISSPPQAVIAALAAAGLVERVIDIHGMADVTRASAIPELSSASVMLGTSGGRTPFELVEHARRCFAAIGIQTGVPLPGQPFAAVGPRTLTSFALDRGLPAIQVEIAGRHRRAVVEDPAAFARLIGAVAALADPLTESEPPGRLTPPTG